VKKLVYNPAERGRKMTIVCFVSGSGTNYREIVARDPNHNYLVFTNRPGCGGEAIARQNKHEIIELSHVPYLREARKRYGPGNVPRNCPERIAYEQDAVKLIENKLGRQPDLICLAGFDQWNTDWMIGRYYPRMLNVHPGDTTKGYIGLHWIPAAQAILKGDTVLRSTLFFADKSEDNGPVLVQSSPLNILQTLRDLEARGTPGLVDGLNKVTDFARKAGINDYPAFKDTSGEELTKTMELVCSHLQDVLKVKGDWKIFPFAVHDLIAQGRVSVGGRDVFVDDRKMPEYGYRLD
jgi:folate-dependent phosphoribosylglycinamide formyltransferase PurN